MKNYLRLSLTCFLRGSLTLSLASLGLFASAQSITWTSSATDIATVNSTTGTITAKQEGTTTITSTTTQNGKTVSSSKTVQVAMQPQSGNIGSGTMSLAACNKTGTMTATVNYGSKLNDMDGSYYTWSSSNTNVATVSNTAKTQNLKSITITAKRNGTATISCSVERHGKSLALSTKAVSVSGINPTFKLNSTANISFTSTGANVHRYATHSYPAGCTGTAPAFTYSSDNSGVATWSGGLVKKGTTNGTTYVRASANITGTWSGNNYIHVTGSYATQICGKGPITVNGVKWAQCNIGATTTTGYGNYYTAAQALAGGICPAGWRLPSKEELTKTLGGVADYTVTKAGWTYYSTSGGYWSHNSTGFIVPLGGRNGSWKGEYGYIWSSKAYGSSAWYMAFTTSGGGSVNAYHGSYTLPIRCVQD